LSSIRRSRIEAKYIIVPAMVMLFVIMITAVSMSYGFNIFQLFSQIAVGGETALKGEYEVKTSDGSFVGQTAPVALSAVELESRPEKGVESTALRILLVHNPKPEAKSIRAEGRIVVYVNEVQVREIPFNVKYNLPSASNTFSLGLIVFTKDWLLQNLGQGANTLKIVVKKIVVAVEYPDGKVETYTSSDKTIITFIFLCLGDQILFSKGVVQPWRL
jgi:hypothetical protein